MTTHSFSGRLLVSLAAVVLTILAACGQASPDQPEPVSGACAEGRTLRFAFYAFFEPVSASADPDPDSAGFADHVGYEADLLTALEEMDGAGLVFDRIPVAEWPDIWLLPAGDEVDVAGGGITILESRTRDPAGDEVVVFTSGHVGFRQSLLVRVAEAPLYATHADLTEEVRVGVLAATTGEARLLQLTGLADPRGTLAEGTRIVTDAGPLVADGSDRYVITAAGSSPGLEGRQRIDPPSSEMPVVVYLGEDTGETELLDALADGSIDAVARGEIGNLEAARANGDGGTFAVTALDPEVELGGWTLPATEPALIACLDEKLDYLTDHRTIGYAEWVADPDVFLRRARSWTP
ncbi:MAG: transporter substrate-binding domain-containing protein [bacterium]|nr:transporter substrate-binding domain-containing protein [bacterium]